MTFLLSYLLKLSISLMVVYSFYFFVLRWLTFYKWNRWYLLLYTGASFYIPFIDISGWFKLENNVLNTMPAFNLSNLPGAGKAVAANHAFTELLLQILPLVLVTGAAVLLIRLGLQYFSFLRLKRKATLISDAQVKIYSVEKSIIPFSMGNSIFININTDNQDELKEIIRHEFVHVKQKHSLDILFTELLCIVNWYNPFAWLIRHAVRQNLEFIADHNVLQNGFDKKQYQYLLLKVIGVSQFSMAPQFNFSSLKKRIIMMNKIKSARVNLVRFLFVLPLIATLLLAFRNKHSVTDKPLMIGMASKLQFADSLPPNVQNLTIQNSKATVTLKNGEVEKYNLKNASEKATFRKKYGELPTPPPPPAAPAAPASLLSPPPPPPPPPAAPPAPPPPPAAPNKATAIKISDPKFAPLYFVNDKEQPAGTFDNNIKPDDIESVEVLKGDNAITKYGDKAKNGIVKITLKKNINATKISKPGADSLSYSTDRQLNYFPQKNGDVKILLVDKNDGLMSTKTRDASQENKLPDNVLYIIDGKESTKSAVSLLNPSNIQSIDVLKDYEATKAYGEKGKNGVIKITTKTIPSS